MELTMGLLEQWSLQWQKNNLGGPKGKKKNLRGPKESEAAVCMRLEETEVLPLARLLLSYRAKATVTFTLHCLVAFTSIEGVALMDLSTVRTGCSYSFFKAFSS